MQGRGMILRVDLTNETITKEELSDSLSAKYLGGEGINVRLLWEHFLEVDPRIDPLDPENVLVIGMGPLGATGSGLGSKTKWTFKSPLTQIYGDTSSSGLLGCHLRWSGYDHVVITGRARHPVYLWVNDDTVEIRDASHIWGTSTVEAEKLLKQEIGNPEIGAATIGQAGENLVRFASIVAVGDRDGIAGRCGGGCIFGSKNLKAVVAYGTKGIPVHDSKAYLRAMKQVYKGLYRDLDMRLRWTKYGTMGTIRTYHDWGAVAYHNCATILPSEEAWDGVSEKCYFDNTAEIDHVSCAPGCACACGNLGTIRGHESKAAEKYAGERVNRPEYGNWASFIGGCTLDDLPAMMHLTNKSNEYGMDTFEVGMVMGLLMDLWEKKIITETDMVEWVGEPLTLEWGNWQSVETIVDSMGLQRDKMGQILKDGLYQTARKIEAMRGVPVVKYAHYGKGGATHEQTAKGYPTMALGMAVAPIGAHHSKCLGISPRAAEVYLGDREAASPRSVQMKGKVHVVGEIICAISNCLGICWFLVGNPRWSPDDVSLELLASVLSASTGEEVTAQDLWSAGERLTNMCKAFNSRLGLTRKDDALSERIMKVPQVEGWTKGWKAEDYIEQLKDEYYEYHGWDVATGLPTRSKLEELGMSDVADVLAAEKAVT